MKMAGTLFYPNHSLFAKKQNDLNTICSYFTAWNYVEASMLVNIISLLFIFSTASVDNVVSLSKANLEGLLFGCVRSA